MKSQKKKEKNKKMEIAQVEISHPDKIIFPKKNITKGDMAEYYER